MTTKLGLAILVTMAAGGACAAAEGGIAAGKAFAQEWCARCHDISATGPFKQHPPSFASIAVFRSPDQIWERIAVPPLHRGMPGLEWFLTGDRIETTIDNLVAYIVSLEPR